jgi:hypothetical protein
VTPHVRRRAVEIARAVTALEAAEPLAHRVASRQAELAPQPRLARFFAMQARQEAFHARTFAAASRCLAPAVAPANPAAPALAALQARLDRDLDGGDLWSSVLGLQVALEALGGAVLDELDAVIAAHVPAFAPVHRLLVRQEASHHAFGLQCLARAVAGGDVSGPRLGAAVRDYRGLAGELMGVCAELLETFGASGADCAARFEAALPAWIREASSA